MLQRECVILLHGLGRTSYSMNHMADALEAAGYDTVNLDYPSRQQRIGKLAMAVIPEGIYQCQAGDATMIHFVTHSMGGILLRYYLARHLPRLLGRVVMLSPPNHGSEVADLLKDNFVFHWLNGPAGQQLGTGPDSLPLLLGPVKYPVGIITGNQSSLFDVFFTSVLPGDDDGKVTVQSARLEGMSDFIVVQASHTFIMADDRVIEQTLHFLRNGVFKHPVGTGAESRR